MPSHDDDVEFVEVEKKKKGGGICKAILRFFGSNIGLFIALREILFKICLKNKYFCFYYVVCILWEELTYLSTWSLTLKNWIRWLSFSF